MWKEEIEITCKPKSLNTFVCHTKSCATTFSLFFFFLFPHTGDKHAYCLLSSPLEFQFFCLQPLTPAFRDNWHHTSEMFQAPKARFCILASLLQAIWFRFPWSARSAGLAHLPFGFQNWTDIFQLLFYILLFSLLVVFSFLQVYIFFNPLSTIWLEI